MEMAPLSPPPSTDLVPRSYDRAAFNVFNGTELQTHTDALTAEQAAQINDAYDIEIYVGAHGRPTVGAPNNLDEYMSPPTQEEYREVADVIAGMQPGDTLFLEGRGYDQEQQDKLDLTPMAGGGSSDPLLWMMVQYASSLLSAKISDRLVRDMQNYKIDTFEYGARLAQLKGITVVHADHDAFDDKAVSSLKQGRSDQELRDSNKPQDKALIKYIDMWRARSGRNVVKDRSLEHLSDAVAIKRQTGRKPKQVYLFGALHKDDLDKTFNDDAGLHATIVEMKQTGELARAEEHGRRFGPMTPAMLGELAARSSAILFANLSQAPQPSRLKPQFSSAGRSRDSRHRQSAFASQSFRGRLGTGAFKRRTSGDTTGEAN
jgi:hypothetical protein